MVLELSSNATKSHGLNFVVQKAFSNRVGKANNYRITREWNSLPNFIKAAPTLSTFKAKLWTFYLSLREACLLTFYVFN